MGPLGWIGLALLGGGALLVASGTASASSGQAPPLPGVVPQTWPTGTPPPTPWAPAADPPLDQGQLLAALQATWLSSATASDLPGFYASYLSICGLYGSTPTVTGFSSWLQSGNGGWASSLSTTGMAYDYPAGTQNPNPSPFNIPTGSSVPTGPNYGQGDGGTGSQPTSEVAAFIRDGFTNVSAGAFPGPNGRTYRVTRAVAPRHAAGFIR